MMDLMLLVCAVDAVERAGVALAAEQAGSKSLLPSLRIASS